jgi:filamentous hemagglutinin
MSRRSHLRLLINRVLAARSIVSSVFLIGYASAGVAASGAAVPVPCSVAIVCGGGLISNWAPQGGATLQASGSTLTVNQSAASVLLNWASFNIASGNTVNFIQPSSSSVALNRIYQSDASQIFGSLNANGTVYLLNQNGFLFGKGAVVNVGALVASSLDITPEALSLGLAGASSLSRPAFKSYTDSQGAALLSGDILVQSGATLSSPGGQVFLFAPNVENDGAIKTPDGQTILGAGQSVFLAASTDPNVRGLLVEVGGTGTATNGGAGSLGGGIGEIIADRGNVTLAGLAVNQNGRVSATTTVNTNGSISLQARATSQDSLSTAGLLQYNQTGVLTLGANSITEVTLQGTSAQTAVDVTAQPKSQISMSGESILVESDARITATGGNVSLSATAPGGLLPNAEPDNSRIWLAAGSVIDVSGATETRSVSDNSLTVQLRGTELANDPTQRDGALRGSTVSVDLRQHGVNPDGSIWIGTPIADLTGDVSAIPHDVFYRNLSAGTVTMISSGSVVESSSANINVSGGQIDWLSGYVKTSILLGANGAPYSIASANPLQAYVGTLDSISVSDPHWGAAVTAAQFGRNPLGTYTQGYVQGFDAGAISIVAPNVVLAGSVTGFAPRGPLQVNPTGSAVSGQLYRFADQVPLGGSLSIGNGGAVGDITQTEVLRALTFVPVVSVEALINSEGGSYNPETDALPTGFVSQMSPTLLGGTGLSKVSVYVEGDLSVPAGTTLAPGAGGAVTLVGGRLDVEGSIVAPNGVITLQALPTRDYDASSSLPMPGLTVGSKATLQVAGEWINNGAVVTANTVVGQTAPLWINGGAVNLISQQGSMVLSAGALISVDGGAERLASGALVSGLGGAIKVLDAPGGIAGSPDFQVAIDAHFEGFAFTSGGTLSISVPQGCLSSMACSTSLQTQFDPSLLTDFGFSRIALGASAGNFEVVTDVNVLVQQRNWQFLTGASLSPSAASLAGLVTPTLLPDYLRVAASLTLNSNSTYSAGYGDLSIDTGARLATDPLGSIALTTDSRIFDNGTLVAPGGRVSLSITGQNQSVGYAADQAIWLGPTALIDVSGTTLYKPNALGLLQGSVLSGGTISVLAQRGYLILDAGSSLLADGAAAVLDLPVSSASTSYQRVNVGSSGGSIALLGAEGVQIDATLSAQAGDGGSAIGIQPAGGSLSVTVDGNLGAAGARPSDTFPSDARVLTVTAAESALDLPEGVAIAVGLQGQGRIAADLIKAGGFDQISLGAADLIVGSGSGQRTAAIGAVIFESGVSLAPRISLSINTGEIKGLGSGLISLTAPIVRLGSTNVFAQDFNLSPQAGDASLLVKANLIDLVGSFDMAGFRSETLASAGAIRLIGIQAQRVLTFDGALWSGGALTLSAAEIYPTTLSNYSIELPSLDSVLSHLTINGVSAFAPPALSAAGTINLHATQIDDAGTLLAPFGQINIQGDVVNLLAGSVTSVSGAGLVVPFGETQGGLDWIYPLNSSFNQVYSVAATNSVQPPQKQIAIRAGTVNLASGASISVAGGGDLQAFEFTSGLGGSTDVLSNVINPGLFAILPSLALDAAPIDPLYSQGFGLSVGQRVYLAGGGGLAPGVYTLLPARYALLPGAYLVKSVSGFTDISPTSPVIQLDGSVVMAGALEYGLTGLGATRSSGFNVIAGSYASREASYTTTSANTFFENQAATVGVTAPRLPADAGAVVLAATTSASLGATIDSSHSAAGSRGGVVEIVGSDLYVSADGASAPLGSIALSAVALNSLGAETLVLGAEETATIAGTQLTVAANNVTVAGDAHLQGAEIILAAQNIVEISGNASVSAVGLATAVEPVLLVPESTALLTVTTGVAPKLLPIASIANGAGAVILGADATLAAPGALAINSAGKIDLAGHVSAAGATVELSSSNVAVGSAPDGFQGLTLTPTLLTTIGSAKLELSSSNAIEFFGVTSLSLDQFNVSAPGLVAEGSGASLTVNAGDISLGSLSTQVVTPSAGDGTLSLIADTVRLTGGGFAVSGTAQTNVTANSAVVAQAATALSAAGDLTIRTSELVASGTYDSSVTAAGHLVLGTAPNAQVSALVPAAAGSYHLAGSDVSIDTAIHVPAGLIEVQALAGDLVLGSQAVLDVAGFQKSFNGIVSSATGGTVNLSAGGSLQLAPGSIVDVSAGTGASTGGVLSLIAPTGSIDLGGQLLGAGAAQQAGASLTVDGAAFSLADVEALNAVPGFTGVWNLRLRGLGDIVVPVDQTLNLTALSLEADQGSIAVHGTVNATTPLGGIVQLAAANDLIVDGTILANATGRADRGGVIDLTAAQGGVYVLPSAVLSVGGQSGVGESAVSTDTGSITIRLPRTAVLSTLDSDAAQHQLVVDGQLSGVSQLTIEGVQSYGSNGQIDGATVAASALNPLYADAVAFGLNSPTVLTALNLQPQLNARVIPGVELDVRGDVTVTAPWDLAKWRFGPDSTLPGVLTVRATGNVFIEQSISDGFSSPTYNALTLDFGPSWSYRLVAGADLSAANPISLQSAVAPMGTADIVLAAGDHAKPIAIRTGTGFIDLAAAGNLQFGNQASVIYTAGMASTQGLLLFDQDSGFRRLKYPVDGGDISITVAQNIIGARSDQLFSDWLWRAGVSPVGGADYAPSAWSVSFGSFRQGIAAVGGGDLHIVAGRDITDLSANVPSIGIPIGDGSQSGTVTQATGSGALDVRAGGSIYGGTFLGMGSGVQVSAGGGLYTGANKGDAVGLNPIFALTGDSLSLTARLDVNIETIVNPTLLPRSLLQPVRELTIPEFYSTYTDASSANVVSLGGDITFTVRTPLVEQGLANLLFDGFFVQYDTALRVFPSSLSAAALVGNINVRNSIDFAPSAHGTLDLLANGSVRVQAENGLNGSIHLLQSDMDPAWLGTPSLPSSQLTTFDFLDTASYFVTGVHALTPVHGGAFSLDGRADTVPNEIVALTGDVLMQPNDINGNTLLLAAKPVDIIAGRDIVDLGLQVQNLSAASVDTITAGRDFVYSSGRTLTGQVAQNTRSIDIAGPGALVIDAGRNVNLQTAAGISSSGNLSNAALPSHGADLTVVAGAAAGPQYGSFSNAYLGNSTVYDQALITYVSAMTGVVPANKTAALLAFKALTVSEQAGLLDQIFIDELRAGGRSAAAAGSGHGDFTRAFAALETLFPGSNPDTSKGELNTNEGDILLYFSRIYTLSGGDINLFAPGGEINVGLAAAPTTFGIEKTPAQLGIVAAQAGSVSLVSYNDVQVNQSRVFAADGGNILIWSTNGNIDAGRGAKSAISAPPPIVTVSPDGKVTTVFPPALTGSGIQTQASTTGVEPGDVDLFAPRGVVNANDAGIVAGNLTIAATAVLGANNISVSGSSVGVPVQATGLGVSVSGAASAGTAATNVGASSTDSDDRAGKGGVSQAALNYLDVVVVGFGEENCRPDDVDCLRRQRHN